LTVAFLATGFLVADLAFGLAVVDAFLTGVFLAPAAVGLNKIVRDVTVLTHIESADHYVCASAVCK
jgi:hypothetical protein